MRLSLEHGADAIAQDINHSTSLHVLAKSEGGLTLDVVRLLMVHGANVDAKDKTGTTLLQVALKRGHDEMARLLSEFRSGGG